MRLHVHLQRHIRIRVLAEMVFEQGQRHDQGHDPLMVLADQLLDFLFVFGADGLLEVASQVLKYVGVGATGRALLERGHQVAEILWSDVFRITAAHAAEHFASALYCTGSLAISWYL